MKAGDHTWGGSSTSPPSPSKGGPGFGMGAHLAWAAAPWGSRDASPTLRNAPLLCAKPEESLGSVPTPASTSPRCLGMSRAALRGLSQALSSNPTRAEPAAPCQGAEQRLFRPSCPPLGCSVSAAFTDPWPRCQSCSPSPSRQLMGAPQKGAVGVQRGHTRPPRAVPTEASCWEQTGSPGGTAHGVGTGTAPRSKKGITLSSDSSWGMQSSWQLPWGQELAPSCPLAPLCHRGSHTGPHCWRCHLGSHLHAQRPPETSRSSPMSWGRASGVHVPKTPLR